MQSSSVSVKAVKCYSLLPARFMVVSIRDKADQSKESQITDYLDLKGGLAEWFKW
jgi:hypothetical protein